MKIDRLVTTNWLAHPYLDLSFSPFTLVCGPNGAGKTSIRDGIAFAMMAELRRVSAKGERDKLITEGQEHGEVSLTCGGVQITRSVNTGKLTQTNALPLPVDAIREAVPYLLDPALFCHPRTDADARRALLFKLLAVSMDEAELRETLIRRGHDAAYVGQLETTQEWATFATGQAAEYRGVWRGITEEAYGGVKAETWTAPAPPPASETETLPELRAQLATLNARLAQHQHDAGAAAANARFRTQLEAQIAAAGTLAAGLDDAITAEKTAQSLANEATAAHERALAASIPVNRTLAVCPECNTTLEVRADGLHHPGPAEPAQTAPDPKPLKAKRDKALIALRQAGQRTQEARAAGERQVALRRDLAALPAATPAPQAQPGGQPEGQPDDKAAAAALVARIAGIEAAERATAHATERTSRAAAAHAAVKAWLAIAEATGPNGIAAELLARKLEPLHATLREIAAAVGPTWPQVSINAGMQVKAGGRPYGLLSKSEQWRVDVSMAVAIAIHSKARFALIDEMDLLDPPSRPAVLKWLYRLTKAGTLDCAILFATLREQPSVPADAAVHWIGAKPQGRHA